MDSFTEKRKVTHNKENDSLEKILKFQFENGKISQTI